MKDAAAANAAGMCSPKCIADGMGMVQPGERSDLDVFAVLQYRMNLSVQYS